MTAEQESSEDEGAKVLRFEPTLLPRALAAGWSREDVRKFLFVLSNYDDTTNRIVTIDELGAVMQQPDGYRYRINRTESGEIYCDHDRWLATAVQ